jgi:hypothetical protein
MEDYAAFLTEPTMHRLLKTPFIQTIQSELYFHDKRAVEGERGMRPLGLDSPG